MKRWVRLHEYPDYEISSEGNVRNIRTGRILSTYKTEYGYDKVSLNDGHGLRRCKLIHTLMAETYIPKHESDNCVVHKDHDPSNNCVENLEWRNRRELERDAGIKHPIRCIETGEVFESITDCSKQMEISRTTISRMVNRATLQSKTDFHFESLD